MTVRVKICGLTRERDLETAVEAGADAIGVIADVPVETPREVPVDRAADLLASAPPFVTTVLVTMADGGERIEELVETVEPDVLQFHGDGDADELGDLCARIDSDLLFAVGADDASSLSRYDGVVDAFLVDTPAVDGGGGTGRTHDWERTGAASADLDSPVVLAGGLTPENVESAIDAADPFGVDVASGVEADGGIKDGDAVRSFVARAKRHHRTEVTT
ncbi:phosphoribosylanthranilate isomerase [Natrarchaeobius chitinivorans]|uniref:N-(5'-phosphoribosyl)anthranilate isomerase n=1 Tax=Natrarchaeobius chitinivorans TaxID=1679083 RepID=A0A3N6LNC8_NATCH|nr:phosphoribosylanthranilate isomerase [Natrarchaeobius chitinivorans]RQG89497.1 phosphoribosylanthranilate isomerase [Natrarchaeobius chitinivorans]